MISFPLRFDRSLLTLLIGLALAAAPVGNAHAQSGMRSVGAVATGGGTSALDTGPAALYSNPANLTVGPGEHTFEIQLLRVGLYSGGSALQFQHYNDTFTGGETLSRSQVDATLDDWFGGSTQSASLYSEVVPVALTYRPSDARWAAGGGIRIRAIGTSAVNEGFFDLLLRGTGTNRTVPVNGRYRVYNTVDVTAAFSYRFSSLPLSVGVSPSLIVGTGFADGDLDSRVTVTDSTITHQFDYAARAAGPISAGLYDTFDAFSDEPVPKLVDGSSGVAGWGGGLDLGGTYTVRPDLHVSMSVTDLGLVQWNRDPQTVTPEENELRFDGFDLNLERLDEEFDGDVGDYLDHQIDSLAQSTYEDVARERSAFTTGLPTTLHVSSTWAPTGLVTLNGGVSVGLNEDAGAVPDPAAVHLGGKLDLGPFPVRLGARFWGTQAVTLSGGLGLDLGVYRIDVGGSVTPSTSTLGSGARYAISLSLGTIRL